MNGNSVELELIAGFIDGLRPEPRYTVWEWADRHRYLSQTSAAEPGLWRTSRTPYLKEIMTRLSSLDPCQEVITMKGAQLGFTECGNNWLGYIIDMAPGPTLMVQPTEETAKRNSKLRIETMVEASPRLRQKIKPARSRDSGNTTLQKDFPGGTVVMTGANSAVGLRSMPVRYLFLDEVDGFVLDLDGEGSPVELAKKRTATFSKRKIFLVSTPTIHGQSVIEQEFEKTDKRYYFVPCPHCGGVQHLRFSQLKWEGNNPDSAKYECEHCRELIEERFKTTMLANGEWIATAPENETPMKYGYHLNSLYAPYGFFSWPDVVRQWLDAQGDVPKLKTFVNTVLGETWKDLGEAPAWKKLMATAQQYEPNTLTNDVVFITAGADVQKDRIEVEIVGWCRGRRSRSIDYRVLDGDTSRDEVWDKLAAVVDEQWVRPDGLMVPMRMMAVDTGYNTQMVYAFARRFSGKVMPVKGQEAQKVIVSSPKQVDVLKNGRKVGGTKLWHVGVSVVKEELYGWLRLMPDDETGELPPGYCVFPNRGETYFRGLTAEKLVMTKNGRGYWVYTWEKYFERNEPLDCRVYARAAANVVGLDRWKPEQWDAAVSEYQEQAPVKKDTPAVRKKKSSYW